MVVIFDITALTILLAMVKHLHETYDIDFAAFIDENLMTMDVASKGTWLKELMC